MGIDCTMYIYNKRMNTISNELIQGCRNSSWFHELMNGDNDFPCKDIDIDVDNLSECIKTEFTKYEDYYGLKVINVKEFFRWINKFKPSLDAGWCTKREAWAYRTRNIIPTLKYWLNDEDIIEDMEFIEIENESDPYMWLRELICKANVEDKYGTPCLEDCDLYYWFDC